MNKIKNHISDTLYERLSSPFAQSFLIAWFAINWRVILLFFTSWEYDFNYRISKIEEYLNWQNSIIYPLVFSFISLIFYVLASYGAYYIWEIFRKAKKKSRVSIEQSTVVTEEDASFLREQIAQANTRIRNLIKSNTEDVQRLENEKNELSQLHRKELEALQQSLKKKDDNINSLNTKLSGVIELQKQNEKNVSKLSDDNSGLKRFRIKKFMADFRFRYETAHEIFTHLYQYEIEYILDKLALLSSDGWSDVSVSDRIILKELRLIGFLNLNLKPEIKNVGIEFKRIALADGY